jgi:hypothetical protein
MLVYQSCQHTKSECTRLWQETCFSKLLKPTLRLTRGTNYAPKSSLQTCINGKEYWLLRYLTRCMNCRDYFGRRRRVIMYCTLDITGKEPSFACFKILDLHSRNDRHQGQAISRPSFELVPHEHKPNCTAAAIPLGVSCQMWQLGDATKSSRAISRLSKELYSSVSETDSAVIIRADMMSDMTASCNCTRDWKLTETLRNAGL